MAVRQGDKTMTREEDIIKASVKWYANVYPDYNPSSAFCRGAKWADQHPQSPWISVEDRLPERVEKYQSADVLVRYRRGGNEYYFVTRYDYEYKDWNISNVTHWMQIPPLTD